MAQAIDFSNINSLLGDYYRENRDVIFEEMFYEPRLSERLDPIDGVTDELPLGNIEVDFELLPGHDKRDWSPQNDAIKLDAQILKTRDIKVDLEIVPAELHRTWYGYKKKYGTDVFDLPFEAFIFQSISKKAMERLHLGASFKGIYNAAGTTTAATVNGFLKLIADDLAAGTPILTPVTTGVVNAGNVIASIEAMCDEILDAYEDWPDWELKVSKDIFNLYWKARRTAFPNLVDVYRGNTGLIDSLPIEGYNVTLKKEIGLGTSQRMILTPKRNMVYGFDSEGDINNIRTEQRRRVLEVMLDFKAGFQFRYLKQGFVIVNDQA